MKLMRSYLLAVAMLLHFVASTGVLTEAKICHAVAPPRAATATPLEIQQRNNELRTRDAKRELQRVARAQLFRDEFATAVKLSVRERLERAATVSGELTKAQSDFLWELVLDDRFRPFWLDEVRREAVKFKGPVRLREVDTPRRRAIRAINAHAGRELITAAEHDELADPKKSESTLQQVFVRLKEFRESAQAPDR